MKDKFDFDLKPIVKEYEKFFGFKLSKFPKSIFCYTREEYEKLMGHKTEDWQVQFADMENIVSIHPALWGKLSCHLVPSVNYFKAHIKHEIIHLFSAKIYGRHYPIYPIWLSEGISVAFSGEMKASKEDFKKPKKFTQVIDFYNDYENSSYIESGYLVQYLYEKFGKPKLFKLLKEAPKRSAPLKFKKLFKSIYKFDLTYEELNKRML